MSAVYTNARTPRPLWPAMVNGMKCRCPACGEGKLYTGYLKIADECPSCGEELHHHRADDAPPYLVIVIVGHIIVGAILHIEMVYTVPPWIYLWTMVPLTVILCLALLPIVKGAVVALQWSGYMHGFDGGAEDDEIETDSRA